ncbi:MAG: rod shape-determining protein RodA [Tepidanaerobacter acetatoxydans]|jgi:rod shape determining protein RodA|uniref:rod shape-determining protein RodA n=1 Tax=Tepidanaerobacter TaxID=499228 RepID=UPI000AEC39BD|nr:MULTISPECIES: rod shape-determining protein RodA [Tepidanaerobacter]NLU10002.1 rod shape-determining protein RodA [Tepidanaerobacter acetatoxydans]
MDRKLLKNIEYPILIAIILLTIISVLMISSATHAMSSGGSFNTARNQLIWFCIGLVAMVFVISIDYHSFANWANIIYIVNLLLLIFVLFIGEEGGGAQRWLDIGPFRLQPSEFAKLAVVITLARHLEKKKSLNSVQDLFSVGLHMIPIMLLIAKQPDLGTSLVLLAMVFGMLFIAGLSYKLLAGIITAGLFSLPILWFFLKPYQKDRILVFINPYLDPLGKGYHVIQSKIAIGSGKIFGKGLYQGTQNQLNFLPVKHTDFIFAVLGEELGFIGGIILFILYFILLYYSLRVAFKARDLLGTYMVVGVVSMWAFQILINIGMNMGIMPVTGIPLPFMSYGGSSFLMNMIAAGLVINVGMRRQKILF